MQIERNTNEKIDVIYKALPTILIKSARQAEKACKLIRRNKRFSRNKYKENNEILKVIDKTNQLYAEFEESGYLNDSIKQEIKTQKKLLKTLVGKTNFEIERKETIELDRLKQMSSPRFWRTIAKFKQNRSRINKCSKKLQLKDFTNFSRICFHTMAKLILTHKTILKKLLKNIIKKTLMRFSTLKLMKQN